MTNEFSRMKLLLDDSDMEKLKKSHVAVFGVGGVGGHVVEAVVRCGVGEVTLIDKDVIDVTNINRQIIALHSTVGRPKVEVMKERILDINPDVVVHTKKIFYNKDSTNEFDLSIYSYVVDAIDTVSSKLLLAEQAYISKVRIISSMGAGNKVDPTMFEVADIYDTSVCPLARVMRRELKKRNVSRLKVVYSKEKALTPRSVGQVGRKVAPGSFSFVPSTVGLIMASEVIKDILKN